MKKWAEIANIASRIRYETLSEFLNELGVENEVHFVECESPDFSARFQELLKDYHLIKLGSPFGTAVIHEFDSYPESVRILKSADTLMWKDKRWQMNSSTLSGLIHILGGVGSDLILGSEVLIVGAGAGARIAVAAFSKLGFSHFSITNKFPEQAMDLISELKDFYFDSYFEFIPQDRLVSLPGTHGICINTTPFLKSNDLLDELYYFNFLKPEGLVFDFTFIPLETPLIKEASDIGIRTVRGFEISGIADCFWVKDFFGVDIDPSEYRRRLEKKIEVQMKTDQDAAVDSTPVNTKPES